MGRGSDDSVDMDNVFGGYGIALRQESQMTEFWLQAAGIPLEIANRYDVGPIPQGKSVKREPNDSNGWAPTGDELKAAAKGFRIEEESSCFQRWCCKNLRAATLHYSVSKDDPDAYRAEKKFSCGAWLCCPFQMTLFKKGEATAIGHVEEDCSWCSKRCIQACCAWTCFYNIQTANQSSANMETKYHLRTNIACCGRTNNCCGASCCKNDAVFDILDARNQEVVAHVQKTYAPASGCMDGAFCRMCGYYSNYLIEFPEGMSQDDRVLIMTAVLNMDFHLFEKPNNDQ